MAKKRRRFTAESKVRVVRTALREDKTQAELAASSACTGIRSPDGSARDTRRCRSLSASLENAGHLAC